MNRPKKKCGKIGYQSLARARQVRHELIEAGRTGPDIRIYRCPYHLGRPFHHGHAEGYQL